MIQMRSSRGKKGRSSESCRQLPNLPWVLHAVSAVAVRVRVAPGKLTCLETSDASAKIQLNYL